MGKDWMIYLVPKHTALGFCDIWIPFIYEAIPRDEWDLPAIVKEIREGTMTLFIVSRDNEVYAVGILQVIQYPLCKKARVFALAGHGMDKWQKKLDEFLSSYALSVEAEGIELVGRRGFARVLKPLGYKERYVVMEKEVLGDGKRSRESRGSLNAGSPTVSAAVH